MRYSCTQRGCEFDGNDETPPEICPVCGNPQNYATAVRAGNAVEALRVSPVLVTFDEMEPRVAALEYPTGEEIDALGVAALEYATSEEIDALDARVAALETAQADKEFGQPHYGHATAGEDAEPAGEDAAPGPSLEDIASGAAADPETEPTVA